MIKKLIDNSFMKKFLERDKFVLFFIFIFISINWYLMIKGEKLACNDFYSNMVVSDKIFAGKFGGYLFVPPLLPILLGIFGRLLNLFISIDGFILAGRLITLFSSFGIVIFTFKLLKIFSKHLAYMGVLFLSVSPFFLKLISTAQSDLLYLFFFTGFIHYLYSDKSKMMYFLSAALTRYEGILLVFPFLINTVKKKYNSWKYMAVLFFISLFSFLFIGKFYTRLYLIVKNLISRRNNLYYLSHPKEITLLIYDNILFFVPQKFPDLLKWLFLYIVIISFIIGLIRVYKYKKNFIFSILFYISMFLIVKGSYIGKLNTQVDFRRFLSVLWLFFILMSIGAYYIVNYFMENFKNKITIVFFIALLSILFVNISVKTGYSVVSFITLIPVFFICFFKSKKIYFSVLLAMIVLLLYLQFYVISIDKSYQYINNDTSTGSYVFSKWVKQYNRNKYTMVYGYPYMLKYYTKGVRTIKGISYKNVKEYEDRELFFKKYFNDLKKRGIKYIFFSGHVLKYELSKKKLLKILFEERDKGKYFKVYKHFKYKGRYAGSVIIPIYKSVENMEN